MKSGIQASQILATSETLNRSPHTPIFSPYRSHVLVSQLLEKVKDLRTRIAGFGLTPKSLLGIVNHNTLSLKTAQHSLFEDCTEYLQDLPPSGMMRNGRIYLAHSSVSSSAVKGFILLPTPLKADSRAACGRGQYFGKLKPGVGYTLCPFIRDGENDGIYPNPELSEVLMTFPASYTDSNVLEMPLYQ